MNVKKITMRILKIGCISFFIIVVLTVILSFKYGKPVEEPEQKSERTLVSDTQNAITATSSVYERLSYEKTNTVENISILVNTEDRSPESLKRLALEIKDKECKLPCNISLFDDKRAAELDNEYKKLTTIEEQNSWKEQNYVYVADHLVGFLEFSSDTFSYYSYRDWYYEELKAGKQ